MKGNQAQNRRKNIAHRIGRSALYVIWAVVAYLASSLVVVWLEQALDSAGVLPVFLSGNQTVASTVLAALIYSMALALLIGGPKLSRLDATTWREMGISGLPQWRDILLTPPAIIIYFILTTVLIALVSLSVPGFDISQQQTLPFEALSGRTDMLIGFIALVIIAPIAEELIFRGYLFAKLRRYLSFWPVALVVSAVFGLLHGQWNVALDTFALSMVMCVFREKTNSLWIPILMHMTKNGIAFFILFVSPMMIGG
ncbi:CPBP family intramembrane metalloprotease [Candidatus Saccharibacteria bacterium]|nr:CPBP family intramembrane metalloprotease [Candidatus Saccharibacteria bacterium]